MSDQAEEQPNRRSRLWMLIPFVLFFALAALFYERLIEGGNPAEVPSVLINKPVPVFNLPGIDGLTSARGAVPGFSDKDLHGAVSLVNVWGSWCLPCRDEHPVLIDLAKRDGIRIYGLDYKDAAKNARRFMDELGNPYVAVGADESGRVAIDWGVYGVPETFVVNAKGCITHKHVGPLSPQLVELKLLPAIRAAEENPTECRDAAADGEAAGRGADS